MNKDRYYLFVLVLAAVVLGSWLAMANNFFDYNVISYDGITEERIVADRQTEARLIAAKTRQVVLGEKVQAATTLVVLPTEPWPTRIASSTEYVTTASSALVMNENDGSVLYAKNADEVRSIASITKLFTALVFLDFNPGWDKLYQMKRDDRREGGRVYLWAGEKVKVKDLFNLSLVASGNSETIALVNATGLGEELFVKKMNEKAKELGLKNTLFKDPVGLNEGNVSTALEVAKFARIALEKEEISRTVKTSNYGFSTVDGRKCQVEGTDELLKEFSLAGTKILGGKTGYNGRAGYCFVGKFSNKADNPVISVVLGDFSKDSRFEQTENLVRWTYDNYFWQ